MSDPRSGSSRRGLAARHVTAIAIATMLAAVPAAAQQYPAGTRVDSTLFSVEQAIRRAVSRSQEVRLARSPVDIAESYFGSTDKKQPPKAPPPKDPDPRNPLPPMSGSNQS